VSYEFPNAPTDFEWTASQRQQYNIENYAKLSEEDAALDAALINGAVEHELIGALDSVIELGVGGVMRGPAFMVPMVRRGGRLHVTDVSESNVIAAEEEMKRIHRGDLGIWTPHQEHMAKCHPAWRGAFGRTALIATFGQQHIRHLTEAMADGLSLSYVAESRDPTDGEEEMDPIDAWRRDIALVCRATRRIIHLRQTDESSGYRVGEEDIDAVSVTCEQTEAELETNGFKILASHTAPKSGHTRQKGDPHNFSGFSGILAERR